MSTRKDTITALKERQKTLEEELQPRVEELAAISDTLTMYGEGKSEVVMSDESGKGEKETTEARKRSTKRPKKKEINYSEEDAIKVADFLNRNPGVVRASVESGVDLAKTKVKVILAAMRKEGAIVLQSRGPGQPPLYFTRAQINEQASESRTDSEMQITEEEVHTGDLPATVH